MSSGAVVFATTLTIATAVAVGLTVAACGFAPLWLLAAPLDVAVAISWTAIADLVKPGGWLGPKDPDGC